MHLFMGADGVVRTADLDGWERAQRDRVARIRADAIGEVAAAFGEECFDAEEVWDVSGLPDAAKDAAAHVAVELARIEALAGFFRP